MQAVAIALTLLKTSQAAGPVTIDPQSGASDFRLSDMGPDGNPNFRASFPAVAYNSVNNEYLVVWEGDDNTAPLADEENEIFGQRINAASGAEIGGDIRLSEVGLAGNANYDTATPAVAYNSAQNEYLVVWYGDDNTPPLADNEYEVFGRRFAVEERIYLPLVLR